MSGNQTYRFPTLVLPNRLTSIPTDTSSNLLLNLSIARKSPSHTDIYSGLCNVTIPDGNNDMIMEMTKADSGTNNVKPNLVISNIENIDIKALFEVPRLCFVCTTQIPSRRDVETINVVQSTGAVYVGNNLYVENSNYNGSRTINPEIKLRNCFRNSSNDHCYNYYTRYLTSLKASKNQNWTKSECIKTQTMALTASDTSINNIEKNHINGGAQHLNQSLRKIKSMYCLNTEAVSNKSEFLQPFNSKITATKRKLNSNSIDANKLKAKPNDPTKKFDSKLIKSTPTLQNNIGPNNRDLLKKYKEEEYACGLILTELATTPLPSNVCHGLMANIAGLPAVNSLAESSEMRMSLGTPTVDSAPIKYITSSVKEANSRRLIQEIEYNHTEFECQAELEVEKLLPLGVYQRKCQCKLCKKYSISLPALEKHLAKRKTTASSTKQDTGNQRFNTLKPSHINLPCKCIVCKKSFTHKNYLQHLTVHRKRFQCNNCSKSFFKFGQLSLHQINAHSKYNCGKCSFSNKNKSVKHSMSNNKTSLRTKFDLDKGNHKNANNKKVQNNLSTHNHKITSSLDTLISVINSMENDEIDFK